MGGSWYCGPSWPQGSWQSRTTPGPWGTEEVSLEATPSQKASLAPVPTVPSSQGDLSPCFTSVGLSLTCKWELCAPEHGCHEVR